MTSRRPLFALFAVLAVLLVPIFGTSPAQAVGTGSPVIVAPADGEVYYAYEVPDLLVDFGDAPYGSYSWTVTDAGTQQVLHSGTVDYDASDPNQIDLGSLADLGLGGYTASVTGTPGTVTSTFGTYQLGEPPTLCTIQLPTQVSVVSPYTSVYPKFSGCEGRTVAWAVRHRVGNVEVTVGTFRIKNGVSGGPWRFRDSLPTGPYRVESTATGDGNDTSLTVKFGSRISLAAGNRVGNRVPLSGVVARYWPAVDGFRRWADRPVAISYKNCAACPWKFLALDRTDANGVFSLTSISTAVRYYRATVGGTSTVWGRTSVPVKR